MASKEILQWIHEYAAHTQLAEVAAVVGKQLGMKGNKSSEVEQDVHTLMSFVDSSTLHTNLDQALQIFHKLGDNAGLKKVRILTLATEMKIQAVMNCVEDRELAEDIFKYSWDFGLDKEDPNSQKLNLGIFQFRNEARAYLREMRTPGRENDKFCQEYEKKHQHQDFYNALVKIDVIGNNLVSAPPFLTQVLTSWEQLEYAPTHKGRKWRRMIRSNGAAESPSKTPQKVSPQKKATKTDKSFQRKAVNANGKSAAKSIAAKPPVTKSPAAKNSRTAPQAVPINVIKTSVRRQLAAPEGNAARVLRERTATLNTRGDDPLNEMLQVASTSSSSSSSNSSPNRRSTRTRPAESPNKENSEDNVRSKRKRKLDEQQDDAEAVNWSEDEDLEQTIEAASLPSPVKKSRATLKKSKKSGGSTKEGGGKRRKWTEEEVAELTAGVKDLGVGQWQNILNGYNFLPSRSAVDLKDKWRNLQRGGNKTKYG